MKPIFKEEHEFLEENLGIKLPKFSWRSGSFIYLNSDLSEYIVRFRVENGKMILVKSKIINIGASTVTIQFNKGKEQVLEVKSWEDEYKEREDKINALMNESLERTEQYIIERPNHQLRLSDSGGKDSLMAKHVCHKVFEKLGITEYVVDFFNTTNETAETYKMVKKHNDKDKLIIQNPDIGWYKWLRDEKNYYIPSVMSRTCCDKFKHGRLSDILEKDGKYIMLLGMRKYESSKRANYDWDLNEAMKDVWTSPSEWKRFLPIVEWRDEEIWLYILHHKLEYNALYNLGFNRVGCLICCFQSDYIDLLTRKYYPTQWARWEDLLIKNYEGYSVEKRLKWSIDEWLNGKWKQGVSKEHEIITKKMTDERVSDLAKLKGIDEEMARKYFKKTCVVCDKKLNSDEIGMNLKIYGRNIDLSKMECKKHFCATNSLVGKDYSRMLMEFRDGNCNLF